MSNTPATTALKPLTGSGFEQYFVFMYSINKSVKKHISRLQSARILDQLRERIRYLHCSLLTEEAYVYWAMAFIFFHDFRHPAPLCKAQLVGRLLERFVRHGVG